MNIKAPSLLLIVIVHVVVFISGCGQQAPDTGPAQIVLAKPGPLGTNPYKQDYHFSED